MQAALLTGSQQMRCELTRKQNSFYRPFRQAIRPDKPQKTSLPLSNRAAQSETHQLKGRQLAPLRAALQQPSDPAAAHDYFATDKRPVVLFDGVCNLCNGAVDFLLTWDKEAKYRLAALQSKAGRDLLQQAGRQPDDLSSVVLVEPGQAYVKSEAVLRIGRRLNTPFYALGSMGLPLPSLLRDGVYDMVAENRYQVFGKTDSCRKCAQGFDERFIAD